MLFKEELDNSLKDKTVPSDFNKDPLKIILPSTFNIPLVVSDKLPIPILPLDEIDNILEPFVPNFKLVLL